MQEYKPAVEAVSNASHIDLPRIYWTTEANAGEYDIPPVKNTLLQFPGCSALSLRFCATADRLQDQLTQIEWAVRVCQAFYVEGQPKIVGYPEVGPYPELTPGSSCTGDCPHGPSCECEHKITYNNTVSNMRLICEPPAPPPPPPSPLPLRCPSKASSPQLAVATADAGGHCHAPACKGIWLHRNDAGHEMELLCHQAPIYGNGTGVTSTAGIYDEKGYVCTPPTHAARRSSVLRL